MVRNSGSSVILHVLDQHSYKQAKAGGTNLSDPQSHPTMNGTVRTDPKLKLCFLEKAKSGYGFSLKSKQGEGDLTEWVHHGFPNCDQLRTSGNPKDPS